MTEIGASVGAAPQPVQTARASSGTLGEANGSDFSALMEGIRLESPSVAAARPSVLKDVALTQQHLMTSAMAPLPDLTHMSQAQALSVMTRKFSEVTMAQMSFSVVSAGAAGAKKSVETVLNQK